MTKLMLHAGGREVTLEELAAVPVPEPTSRWYPIGHATVIETVTRQLEIVGLTIERTSYGLSKDDGRMFATFDLGMEIVPGVTLAAGVRNSIDKSFPLGFCAGNRVCVCDNLAFSAELMVRRKHTRFGHDRFKADITDTVGRLAAFRAAEVERIVRMQGLTLTDTEAESFMLRAYEHDFIQARYMQKLIEAWREPAFEGELAERTAWSLFNCFTLVMADRQVVNPQAYAAATMKLQALLSTPTLRIEDVGFDRERNARDAGTGGELARAMGENGLMDEVM